MSFKYRLHDITIPRRENKSKKTLLRKSEILESATDIDVQDGIAIDLIPSGVSSTTNKTKRQLHSRSHDKTSCLLCLAKCWLLRRPPSQSTTSEWSQSQEKDDLAQKTKPKVKVETGYLKPLVRRFNLTLPLIRKMSSAVLQKQQFERHTKMNQEGFLLKANHDKPFSGLEPISEETDLDDAMQTGFLETVNYVLQTKLDDLIALPSRPVDGFNEARIVLSRESVAKDSRSRSSRVGSRSSQCSSLSSIPSKVTHVVDTKSTTDHDHINPVRGLLSMQMPVLFALLPTLSEMIRHELTHDYEYILKYSKILENLFVNTGQSESRKLKKTSYSSERWLAVIYIDYRRRKPIEAFRRLLVKLILHKYLVAFEEKDLSREEFCNELSERVGFYSQDFDVPFVFTNGVPIGGCSMMYHLFNIDIVDKIFKHSIMDPDKYHRWLHNPIENVVREQLLLRVPLASFPLVQGVMKGTIKEIRGHPSRQTSQTMESFVVDGAYVVNQAQRKWNEILREMKYTEPQILLYVQLKSTIFNVLNMMEAELKMCSSRRPKLLQSCFGLSK